MWGLEGPLVPTFPILAWIAREGSGSRGRTSPAFNLACGEQEEGRHSLVLLSFNAWVTQVLPNNPGLGMSLLGQGCPLFS